MWEANRWRLSGWMLIEWLLVALVICGYNSRSSKRSRSNSTGEEGDRVLSKVTISQGVSLADDQKEASKLVSFVIVIRRAFSLSVFFLNIAKCWLIHTVLIGHFWQIEPLKYIQWHLELEITSDLLQVSVMSHKEHPTDDRVKLTASFYLNIKKN